MSFVMRFIQDFSMDGTIFRHLLRSYPSDFKWTSSERKTRKAEVRVAAEAREGGNMPAKPAAHGYPAAATAGYGK